MTEHELREYVFACLDAAVERLGGQGDSYAVGHVALWVHRWSASRFPFPQHSAPTNGRGQVRDDVAEDEAIAHGG